MKKIKNNLIKCSLLAFSLSACSSNLQEGENKINDRSSSSDSDYVQDNTQSNLKVVENKCIGCGRCTRVAPEYFAMDSNTQKAVAISQDNLESDLLYEAISICPTSAIEI